MVVAIEKSHNMDFITIQGLMRKLQAHEESVNPGWKLGRKAI